MVFSTSLQLRASFLQLARTSHLCHGIFVCHQLKLLNNVEIKKISKVKNLYLKPRRHPLIHFQVLFCTVQGTSAFLVQHFPSGKVPDTVIEADLTELVVV